MALQIPPTSARLLERDGELETLHAALAGAARGAGGLVMLDGPAGAGKTALLDAARATASDAGLLVLRARGAELERAFGFGVVRQLFDEVVHSGAFDPAVLFTGAARFAAPLLDVSVEGVSAVPEDPFAARHALYWLTANLAAERRLAMLVDDGHWADTTSLGVLGHLANRLEGIPVALIVASRVEESQPGLDALRLQAGEAGALLRLQPLGATAAAAVVRSLAPAADDALCHACHVASGGNPFLLHELVRATLDGAVDRAQLVEQSPERVTREIAARLAQLPEGARNLAGAAAVLGGGVALRQAARLVAMDEDAAAEAADALLAKGILRSAHPVEFLHPLVRAAVYAGLGPAARSLDHARAAHLLAEEGESPDRVAAQLLRCRPAGDRWAYDRLIAAARLAAARGAADAVATYLQRALDEPAPPEHRADILLELGAAESQFDPVAAIFHLREAFASEITLEQRFNTTMLLAGLLGQTARTAEAADVLEAQFEAFADRQDLLAPTEAAFANVTRTNPVTRPRAAAVIARLRGRVDAGESDPAVLGTIAAEMGMAGEPVDVTGDMAERAIVGIEPAAATATGWSWFNAVRSLVVSERYDVALRVMDEALERARERGAVIDVGGVLTFRSELYTQIGDLASAEVDGRTLHEISTGYGWPLGEGFAVAVLGEVLVERGELEEAERLLCGGAFAGPAVALPEVYPHMWVLLIRGVLRIAQQRWDNAVEELRECGRRTLAVDHVSPATSPWRSLLAIALAELGQREEAQRLAAEELERARALGGRRAIGVALCGAAHVAGGAEKIRLLREATAVLDASQAQLERARAHSELGAGLRRAGDLDGARESLRVAIDVADRCGATGIQDFALAELRATGARPRRRVTTGAGALTPSERRIAELAADGQQNREIAEALFVTTATVEYHLRNAYRKLGIGSRTQLGAAMA